MRKLLAFTAAATLLFGWSTASAGSGPTASFASQTELQQIDQGGNRQSAKPRGHADFKGRCAGEVLNSDGALIDTSTLVASMPYCAGAI